MAGIAFVSKLENQAFGGSEYLWTQAALRLRQRGLNLSANVTCLSEQAAPIQELARAGCRVTYRRPGSKAQRIVRRVLSPTQTEADPFLDREKPDLVIFSVGGHLSDASWPVACIHRKIPYILIVQAADENTWPGSDAIVTLYRDIYQTARLCCFVSEGNREVVRTQMAIPLPEAVVVRNPFNVRYEAAPPWPEEDTIRLACIGRLEPFAKGQDILFQVLRAEKWRQRPIQVNLFGGGSLNAMLESLQQQYGLTNVRFEGFTDDIEAVWSRHHALVLPSRYEGLPLVVVEAMLCGRPCIVTDVAGNAELLEDGVSGFVAQGAHVQTFDAAMERAWERRAEWRQIGQAAATAVRRQVPRDPVADFLTLLEPFLP